MRVIAATRLVRPRWWPGVAAWALWALTLLGLATIAWLDQLSRQAGRPDVTQLGGGLVQGPVLGLVSATTVGAVLASRRPHHPVGWLLLAFGLSLSVGGVMPPTGSWPALAPSQPRTAWPATGPPSPSSR